MAPSYRPPADARWRARVAAWLLQRWGWRLVLAAPAPPRCVVVFYPHTSNWDFPVGLLARWALDRPVHWVGKDSLFRWPVGRLLEGLGGIPVNRRRRTGFIDRLAAEFRRRTTLWLVIAPEGTRARTDFWRSGFYHLARRAEVPLALAYGDWGTRELGVGRYVTLCGNVEADMAEIAAFYAGKQGRVPGRQGAIRLRDDPSPIGGWVRQRITGGNERTTHP